jgi:competence protein ComEC
MRVTFIDAGQGDSALVEFPDGKTMLIDGGGNPRGIDPGRAAVAPYLWDRGIRHIDLLVLSHPHPDHAGGLAYILGNFKVGQVWEGWVAAPSAEYAAFNGLARSKKIQRWVLTNTGEMVFGGAVIQVLSSKGRHIYDSDKEDYVRENNRSLVLRIKYGAVSVLFPGDIQVEAEEALLHASPPLPLKSTVLKAPHHGGRSSLNKRFMLAVKPEVAAVSVGRSFYGKGFSAETTGFLEGMGAMVYNTLQSGAVVFHTNGKTWGVETFKDRELKPAAGPMQELENYKKLLS